MWCVKVLSQKKSQFGFIRMFSSKEEAERFAKTFPAPPGMKVVDVYETGQVPHAGQSHLIPERGIGRQRAKL